MRNCRCASENARKVNALNRFALSLAGCVFRSLLLRNQQVAGSNPATSSKKKYYASCMVFFLN